MAPKRAAKKAAPPPAESSDETSSGSRSHSEESDDEDAIAESPVPAATPALKNSPAPSHKGGESESSDEDGEEEEEPAPAAPKNQPPPSQKKENSESSGDEDDDEDDEEEEEEEEDDEDEEEEEEPTREAPPSAQKKQPPQPQNKEDSDTSGDDDEEEAPPPKPAARKEAEVPKPAAAAEAKKPGAFKRIWSTDDEVRILEALAAHQKQHGTGTFPQPDALVDVLAGKLDNPAYGSKELQSKVQSLRARYLTLIKRAKLPNREHDRRLLDLSKLVWASSKASPAADAAAVAAAKGFEEMCEQYPFLAKEVRKLEAAHPGMCKREFGKMDDDKARTMDEKIKKQRLLRIKVETRSANLAKEVTKALIDLVDA